MSLATWDCAWCKKSLTVSNKWRHIESHIPAKCRTPHFDQNRWKCAWCRQEMPIKERLKHIGEKHLGEEVSPGSAHQQNGKSRAGAEKRQRDDDEAGDAHVHKAKKLSPKEGISQDSAIIIGDDDITTRKEMVMAFEFGLKQGKRKGTLNSKDIDRLKNADKLTDNLILYGMLRIIAEKGDVQDQFHCIDPLLVKEFKSFPREASYVLMPVCEDDHWYLIIIAKQHLE